MNTKQRERFDALRRRANRLGFDVHAGFLRIGCQKHRGYMITDTNVNGVVAGGDPFAYNMCLKEVREFLDNREAATREYWEEKIPEYLDETRSHLLADAEENVNEYLDEVETRLYDELEDYLSGESEEEFAI